MIMLLAVASVASEMDTLFAITTDGETVGLVYRKGEIPVIPEGMRLVDEVSAVEVVEQPVAEAVEQPAAEPAFVNDYASAPVPQAVRVNRNVYSGNGHSRNLLAQIDSVEYYQNLVDRYNRSGETKKRLGNRLMIGGGVAAVLGSLMMLDSYNEDNDEFLLGYLSMFFGTGAFVTGVFVKRAGVSRLHRAKDYEEKLLSYQNRNAYAVKVAPVVNPISRSVGGALALNF